MKHRLDPGMSIDDILAFDIPLATSNEFRLALDGHVLKSNSKDIGYKIPRSFFAKK